MPDDDLLNALRRKLATYEGAGLDELAKRIKARIAELEKPAVKAVAPKPVATAKKAVKKTVAKKATARKGT